MTFRVLVSKNQIDKIQIKLSLYFLVETLTMRCLAVKLRSEFLKISFVEKILRLLLENLQFKVYIYTEGFKEAA